MPKFYSIAQISYLSIFTLISKHIMLLLEPGHTLKEKSGVGNGNPACLHSHARGALTSQSAMTSKKRKRLSASPSPAGLIRQYNTGLPATEMQRVILVSRLSLTIGAHSACIHAVSSKHASRHRRDLSRRRISARNGALGGRFPTVKALPSRSCSCSCSGSWPPH